MVTQSHGDYKPVDSQNKIVCFINISFFAFTDPLSYNNKYNKHFILTPKRFLFNISNKLYKYLFTRIIYLFTKNVPKKILKY